MHEQDVAAWRKDAQISQLFDERFDTEGNFRQCAYGIIYTFQSYRLINDTSPSLQVRTEYPVHTRLFSNLELGTAGGNGQGGFECLTQRIFIQVYLGGQSRQGCHVPAVRAL